MRKFLKKKLVPWDPLGVPRVPILGPAREMFSKLDGPGPLGSGDHSHTSFSTGEFRAAQRTLGSDVQKMNRKEIWLVTIPAYNQVVLSADTPDFIEGPRCHRKLTLQVTGL